MASGRAGKATGGGQRAGRVGWWVLCAVLGCGGGWGAAGGHELPQWSAEDHDRYFRLGFLPPLGEELWPREGALPEQELGEPEELDPGEAGHLLGGGEPEEPPVELPGELPPLRVQVEQGAEWDPPDEVGGSRPVVDISEGLLRTYLRSLPAAYLIDPRELLEESKARDAERFLRWHTGEGGVPIYLVILDKYERLPEFIDLGEWCRALGGEGPAALAIFPVGGPQLAALALSPELSSGHAGESSMAILEDCIAEAMVSADPRQQMERFYVRLSLRLFWLDRSLARAAGRAEAQVPEGLAEAAGATGESERGGVLAGGEEGQIVGGIVGLWAAGAGGLIGVVVLVAWLRSRSSRGVWVLEGHEVGPRLGAPHCGGAGAAVEFGRSRAAGGGGRGQPLIDGVRRRIRE